MAGIYRQLQEKLDTLGGGFPASGVGDEGPDINFLKRFYSEEDAWYILRMVNEYQTAHQFATANGIDPDVAAEKLYDISKRGLIYRQTIDGVVNYRLIPMVHGTYEFLWPYYEKGWLDDYYKMMDTGRFNTDKTTPMFRQIPVCKEVLSPGTKLLPFDDLEAILDKHTSFSVAACACRLNRKARELPVCDHEIETCINLGGFADYSVENGFARRISREEVMELLQRGVEEGRVISAMDSQEVEVICSCCKCCCGPVMGKTFIPNLTKWNNYVAVIEDPHAAMEYANASTAACPIKACRIEDGALKIDVTHCMGCGLCALACKNGAIKLHARENPFTPEDNVFDTYDIIAQANARKRAEMDEKGGATFNLNAVISQGAATD